VLSALVAGEKISFHLRSSERSSKLTIAGAVPLRKVDAAV